MADKEKQAYWKGYNDEKYSEKHPSFWGSNYQPPSDSGQREAYDAGWERAKRGD